MQPLPLLAPFASSEASKKRLHSGCPIINKAPWWSSSAPNGSHCIAQACPDVQPAECDAARARQCEAAAVAKFRAELGQIRNTLAAANAALGTAVALGAVQFDCEVGLGWDHTTPADVIASIARQTELTVNTTREVFPAAVIVNYGFGDLEWHPTMPAADCAAANTLLGLPPLGASGAPPAGWCARPSYTYRERFPSNVPLTVSLYMVPEPVMTREMFRWTAAAAVGRGIAGGAVVPYISLGMGYRRNSSDPAHPVSMHAPRPIQCNPCCQIEQSLI